MGLSVTVLGCCGSYPGRDGACSGYLVQSDGFNLVLDAGPGVLANLQRHIGLDAVDAVVLSHSHPDHWTDLVMLRTAWRWELDRAGLPVYGTEETLAKAELLDGPSFRPTVEPHVIDETSELVLGPLGVRFSRTDHYVETLAARIDLGGRSLAYSADTGPGWSFAELGKGIDLALCEATVLAPEEAPDVLHLSARQAGQMSREAGVPRLVLTHLWPTADPEDYRREGAAAYGAPVEIAALHERYEV